MYKGYMTNKWLRSHGHVTVALGRSFYCHSVTLIYLFLMRIVYYLFFSVKNVFLLLHAKPTIKYEYKPNYFEFVLSVTLGDI